MKFIGNGVVWDIESDKPLCEFVNGEFITDDVRIIEKLINNECKIEKVEEKEIESVIENIVAEEIDLGQSTSQKGNVKKILKSKTE